MCVCVWMKKKRRRVASMSFFYSRFSSLSFAQEKGERVNRRHGVYAPRFLYHECTCRAYVLKRVCALLSAHL